MGFFNTIGGLRTVDGLFENPMPIVRGVNSFAPPGSRNGSLTVTCQSARMVHLQDKVPFSDRRLSERTATTLRGKIFPGNSDCTIRDVSRQGARLGFVGELQAEEPSVVVIWATGLAFEVIKRWMAHDEIGVLIRRRYDLRGRVPQHLVEIKALWLGRRRRLRRDEIKGCNAIIGSHAPPSVVRIS